MLTSDAFSSAGKSENGSEKRALQSTNAIMLTLFVNHRRSPRRVIGKRAIIARVPNITW